MFETGGAAAPDLLNVEAVHALREHEHRRLLDADRSREALSDLMDLPIVRYPTLQLMERAWELRHNFTAYDATYVALAEALGTGLLTADRHLARAAEAYTDIRAVLLDGKA